MKTTTKVWLGASALLALVVALYCLRYKPWEPSYQGKSLSEWLRQADLFNSVELSPKFAIATNELVTAIQTMGTNCLPFLIEQLQTKDTKVRDWLITINKIQGFTQIPIGLEAKEIQFRAVEAFMILGPTAKPAIPQLTSLLYDTNTTYFASLALMGIGKEAHPALLQALQHTNAEIRGDIVFSIQIFNIRGAFAVPSIINLLNDKDPTVRNEALTALGLIASEPEISIPALIKTLSDPDDEVKVRAARALGQFRTNAAPALPAMQQLLTRTDLRREQRESIEKAIKKISIPTPPPPSKTP